MKWGMDLEFGKQIMERRKFLGLTQAQAAGKCGVNQAYISRLEKGVGLSTMNNGSILAICNGLDFDPRRLFLKE
jgi:transcriptional regulator with XRE-family HTH domain